MLDPEALLEVANTLYCAGLNPEHTASAACLRRSVSTAYYAVFHSVLRAGAARLVGPAGERRPAYAILYRKLAKARLDVAFQKQSGLASVAPETRDFASLFIKLQEARVSADYDPGLAVEPSTALELLGSARIAIAAFARILHGEQADLLALMLVAPRP